MFNKLFDLTFAPEFKDNRFHASRHKTSISLRQLRVRFWWLKVKSQGHTHFMFIHFFCMWYVKNALKELLEIWRNSDSVTNCLNCGGQRANASPQSSHVHPIPVNVMLQECLEGWTKRVWWFKVKLVWPHVRPVPVHMTSLRCVIGLSMYREQTFACTQTH